MRRLTLIALSACGMLMTGCAEWTPALSGAPQVEMPPEARRSCQLSRLPADPTQADLEALAQSRGADIVACDAARRLAVQTHDDEHALEARAMAERAARTRPWWKLWP